MEKSASVTIVVCTYKRPKQLRLLLNSLRNQKVSNLNIKIRVIDNDVELTAKETVDSVSDHFPWPICYISQPVKNISLTRNAGIASLDTDYMAFVDDDEVASESWIASLVGVALSYNADVVFGPVLSVYPAATPKWIKYDRPRHLTGTSVPLSETRTGNVLIRVPYLYSKNFLFDTALGLSGGEDSEFFREMYKTGCVSVWSDEAVVEEEVPVDRTRPKWFLLRSFRIGSVEASLSLRNNRIVSIFNIILKSLALMALNFFLLLMLPVRGVGPTFMSLRNVSVAAGMIYGVIKGPFNEYK